MKLYEILTGASFFCIVVGLMGIMGAIEYGTGLIESLLLLSIGTVMGLLARYKSEIRTKNRPQCSFGWLGSIPK